MLRFVLGSDTLPALPFAAPDAPDWRPADAAVVLTRQGGRFSLCEGDTQILSGAATTQPYAIEIRHRKRRGLRLRRCHGRCGSERRAVSDHDARHVVLRHRGRELHRDAFLHREGWLASRRRTGGHDLSSRCRGDRRQSVARGRLRHGRNPGRRDRLPRLDRRDRRATLRRSSAAVSCRPPGRSASTSRGGPTGRATRCSTSRDASGRSTCRPTSSTSTSTTWTVTGCSRSARNVSRNPARCTTRYAHSAFARLRSSIRASARCRIRSTRRCDGRHAAQTPGRRTL